MEISAKPTLDFSVVVPVFNSAETLERLFLGLKKIFEGLEKSFEVIFVEDCGPDNSWDVLVGLRKQFPGYISIIKLTHNYGQHAATMCGIAQANGNLIVTIDDDLQVLPKEIIKLYDRFLKTDADIVYGYFPKKQHSYWKNLGGSILQKYAQKHLNAPGKGSSFRLVKNGIGKKILNHHQNFVYIDEVMLWYAGNTEFVEVEHLQRENKKSGYNFIKLLKIAMKIILISTVTPLRIMIYGGFFFSLIGFIEGAYLIYRKIFKNVPYGYTSIIVSILFSTSLLLFFLGILGYYMSRIYMSQNKKPPYLIKHKIL
jgi:glycosyltransferase involved in cell wall biosynthesis